MNRIDIIETVGKSYLKTNIENGEYSYAKALKAIGKNYVDYLTDDAKSKHKDIDLRFVDKGLTILIETKSKLTNSNFNKDRNQLQNYVLLEKELTGNKVIAILMATSNDSFNELC